MLLIYEHKNGNIIRVIYIYIYYISTIIMLYNILHIYAFSIKNIKYTIDIACVIFVLYKNIYLYNN